MCICVYNVVIDCRARSQGNSFNVGHRSIYVVYIGSCGVGGIMECVCISQMVFDDEAKVSPGDIGRDNGIMEISRFFKVFFFCSRLNYGYSCDVCMYAIRSREFICI